MHAGAGLVAAAGTLQAASALIWWPAVRRQLPRLHGTGSPDHLALTFDDGPDPESTPRLLDLLADLGVRATFFVLGSMVAVAPDLTRRLVTDGHELGLHGWHHRNSLLVAPVALRRSLVRALDTVQEVAGTRPVLYRPPYGVVTGGTLWAAHSLGLSTVLWGAWGQDWSVRATPSTVLRSLAPDVRGGATVLLHDSDCTSSPGAWRSMLGAVRPLVDGARDAGLRVGPLGEHELAAHGSGSPHRCQAGPVGRRPREA